jgi:hypothetical protein
VRASSQQWSALENKKLDPFLITKVAARLGLSRIEYLNGKARQRM